MILANKQICEVVHLANATLDLIVKTFRDERYRDRIAIFHFGGHADSYQLYMQSFGRYSSSVKVSGLATFLAEQRGLQLVFLNGCLTAPHAQDLSNAGIAAIIGTVKKVDDRIATELAISFYKGITAGNHLDRAWMEALGQCKAKYGTENMNVYYHQNRDLGSERRPSENAYDRFPWEIFYQEGNLAIKNWNLPDAAGDPLFGLPNVIEKHPLPNKPFQFLKRYEDNDAGVFFGRGRYIRNLYNRVTSTVNSPVICLYGQSGVGKSSLLEAGLLPRLENDYIVKLIRRDDEIPILEQIRISFELEENQELGEDWKALESKFKKPVVIIIDQFERIFTHPIIGYEEELKDFLGTIRKIFDPLEDNPRGKLILSYRKEYDPEIEQALVDCAIYREKAFLDKFSKPDIIEVVNGISSTQQLIDKYNVSIDPELANTIADNLLKDSDAPISPVLQIILTKLWDNQRLNDQKVFTLQNYQKLQTKGILLDEFFDQQMRQIKVLEQELDRPIESSGLALDVLHTHTNERYATAKTISLENLRQQYEHQHEIIHQLVEKFEDLYLLNPVKKAKRSALADEPDSLQETALEEATTLSHDTLAPIVKNRMRQSERRGQKALHILNSKMAVYDELTSVLQEDELELVEQGERRHAHLDDQRKGTH